MKARVFPIRVSVLVAAKMSRASPVQRVTSNKEFKKCIHIEKQL